MSDTPGNWGKWGAGDERGTLNYITGEKTREAAALVRTGKTYPLAIPLKAKGPIWPSRHKNWHVAMSHNVDGPGPGGGEDILMMHTHGTTHVDALCHVFSDGKFYNGHAAKTNLGPRGAQKNAISNVGAIVTKGVLLDVAGHYGVDHLEADHEITVEEVDTVALEQGVSIGSGDALLFRTGWLNVWSPDNEEFFDAAQPGPSLAVAEWAGEKEVAVMAADNSAVEIFPLDVGQVVHQEFIWKQGGYLMELLDLEALAADKVYEFLFVVAPLNIAMGMGSPITPLAIC
ncbi:MAG: cyclase family protein [Candidatus Hydrogenedentes bacterium]|jgi:kynurenine formamidase|nr:cyclase family protein [Candidatus Hydrogenedentota bacterium]